MKTHQNHRLIWIGRALAVTGFSAATLAGAATTGNLHLEGRVRPLVAIEVSAVDPSSSLDLTTDARDLKVANVKEFSNSQDGYRVTLASKHAGNLRNARADGQVVRDVAYQASYEGKSVKLSATPEEVTRFVNVSGAPQTFMKSFNISYQGQAEESLPSGTYQDDLVFEISAL